jgi:hypothetical protein
MASATVIFQHRARGDFLRAATIATRTCRAAFDVLVHALFCATNAPDMFGSWHDFSPSDVVCFWDNFGGGSRLLNRQNFRFRYRPNDAGVELTAPLSYPCTF